MYGNFHHKKWTIIHKNEKWHINAIRNLENFKTENSRVGTTGGIVGGGTTGGGTGGGMKPTLKKKKDPK